MFARIVTMPLKPGSASEFFKAIEKGAIPLLRKHKGFVDELALLTDDGKIGLGISFWDSKESAEAYSRSGFGDVMKALDKVVGGPTELKICQVSDYTAPKIARAHGA